MILEWCQQCGIFWNGANSVVFFGMVPTVWYYQRSYLWVHPLCLGRLQVSLTAALLTNVLISGSVLWRLQVSLTAALLTNVVISGSVLWRLQVSLTAALLTNVVISGSVLWNPVVHCFIDIEMERLECIKDEVSHILIHVCPKYTSVKVINSSATVHHL